MSTVLTFISGERQKIAGKKVCSNRVSNLQLPDHKSDMVPNEIPGRVHRVRDKHLASFTGKQLRQSNK